MEGYMILRILEGSCKRLAASIYRLGSPEWFDERQGGGLPPAILHIPGDRYVAQFLHHAGPFRTAREPTLPWEHDVWRRPWMGRQCRELGNHDCRLSGARRQFHRHRQRLYQRPFREDHRRLLRKEGKPRSRRDRHKFCCSLFEGDPNGGGAGRKALIQQCEASLRRLQTDYIDIYWLHIWDRTAPIEETLRGLDDLVASGKVRYIGFSNLPAWKVSEAQTIAHFRSWAPIIAVQLEYSLLERTAEGELFPMAQEMGIGIMPWSPLKHGFLSGKFRRENAGSVDTKRTAMGVPSETDYLVIDALCAVAEEVGATAAAVALAWVWSRPGVESTLIGARRPDQLQANLAALDLILTDAQMAQLNEASKPALNFPADINNHVAPMFGFPGTTIDGYTAPASPMLSASANRY